MFCKHDWLLIIKTATEPTTRKGFECSEDMAERLLSGVTTIIFQCRKCKKLRKEEMLGKEVV